MEPIALKHYIATFIPIFLAVDILGTVPLYLGLTEKLNVKQRSKVLAESILTASALAVVFVLLGKLILRGLGISIDDFRIAGGILLFLLSVYLLMPGKSRAFVSDSLSEDICVFPLAVPLITGPAVLVTSMMLVDVSGTILTLSCLLLNMAVAWIVLFYSSQLLVVFGSSGIKAISKISYIFLAAIAVHITRMGVAGLLTTLSNR